MLFQSDRRYFSYQRFFENSSMILSYSSEFFNEICFFFQIDLKKFNHENKFCNRNLFSLFVSSLKIFMICICRYVST
jgi:hypothetical protein